MARCAGSGEYGGSFAFQGDYIYIYPEQWGPMEPEYCKFMLLTPEEYQEVIASLLQSNSIMFPIALVVVFVLGWIAGAQR